MVKNRKNGIGLSLISRLIGIARMGMTIQSTQRRVIGCFRFMIAPTAAKGRIGPSAREYTHTGMANMRRSYVRIWVHGKTENCEVIKIMLKKA